MPALGGSYYILKGEFKMAGYESYKFLKSHEWVSAVEDGVASVGISDYAQKELSDVVFVEMNMLDEHVDAGQEVAMVESNKTASDIYSPVSGTIVEFNEELEDAPELINESPYEKGWIFKIKLDNPSELDSLMSFADYEASL